ncbi:MAG: hypothetical protein LBN30_00360 [Oscillospiraceae bacterium]|jgi:hypothetical protein|nr:hypothetical protein [Oscillospiraceae bacterium]
MTKTEIYIAASIGDLPRASSRGFRTADMIYRVSGSRLYRARGARGHTGRVMVLDTTGFTGGGPLRALAEEVAEECTNRGYVAIVFDTGGGNEPHHATLARQIAEVAPRLTLILPETLATACPNAEVMIQTAISCGNLRNHIRNAMNRYGRVALELAAIRMDFAIPARSGGGEPLTEKQLDELFQKRGKRAFFSDDLFVNYFTHGGDNGARFTLYDDSESVNRKLNLARTLGIEHVFLFYPQIAGFINQLDV